MSIKVGDDLVIKRCDKCGKYFELKVWQDDIEIHGVSPRCSERVWRLCPDCLSELIEFIDGPVKVRNKTWDMDIRITKVMVSLGYITIDYTVSEEPYTLCNKHLRTWKAYDETER